MAREHEGMDRRHGRTAALASAAAAIVVLLLAGVLGRGAVAEWWYIFRLGSPDEDARLAAANKLGEMGSVRAVPRLLELIKQEPREAAMTASRGVAYYSYSLTPLAYAVYHVGPAAVPILEGTLETLDTTEWQSVRSTKGVTFGEIEGRLSFARGRPYIVEWIIERLRSPEPTVKRMNYPTEEPLPASPILKVEPESSP
jgi:hypothetical protein